MDKNTVGRTISINFNNTLFYNTYIIELPFKKKTSHRQKRFQTRLRNVSNIDPKCF